MKKKTTCFISQLLVAGFILILLNNCKKQEIKRDPIITWRNPQDIFYGTLLSKEQLNATADVPGTFVYTPAIGTILNAGLNQDLKVDFIPTDASAYNIASKTVKIYVIAFSGTVTDIDSNVYHTITLGTQTWMAENLKTTKYNNGTDIPNVTDGTAWSNLSTPGFCWQNNNAATYKDAYGALYNWHAVNTGKLAPIGWHVPTDAEWTTLENYLSAHDYNYDSNSFGDRTIAKALASANGWMPNTGEGTVGNTDYLTKRNATGFTALPGGFRDSKGSFNNISYTGIWWSTSEDVPYNTNYVWYRSISYDNSYLHRDFYYKEEGFSVRCIKD